MNAKQLRCNVPGGTNNRVQPLDVSINMLFKNYKRELYKQYFGANYMRQTGSTLAHLQSFAKYLRLTLLLM